MEHTSTAYAHAVHRHTSFYAVEFLVFKHEDISKPEDIPACLSMSSRRGMLIVSSTVQGLLTCPLMQYSLVPVLLGRPKLANHSGPRRSSVGTTANVSTLLTVVGQP
jgi:hypothetical protein